jgi:hypothetical protein
MVDNFRNAYFIIFYTIGFMGKKYLSVNSTSGSMGFYYFVFGLEIMRKEQKQIWH